MNEPRVIAYYPDFCTLFDGCVSCAVLLSQLVYWHGVGKDGMPRYNVSDHKGNFWLAKSFSEWHQETGISRDKFYRALGRLRALGIITTKVMRFAGSPTLHVRFLALKGQRKTITAEQIINDHVQLSDSHMSIPANANVDTCKFTTDTTSETTTHELEPAVGKKPNPNKPLNPIKEDQPQGQPMNLKETLSIALEKQSSGTAKPGVLELRLASLWKKTMAGITNKYQAPLRKRECGQLKLIMDALGPVTNEVVVWTLENWSTFTKRAVKMEGLVGAPSGPHVGFFLMHVQSAYSTYQDYVVAAVETAPVVGTPKNDKPPQPTKITRTSKHLILEELAKEGVFPN